MLENWSWEMKLLTKDVSENQPNDRIFAINDLLVTKDLWQETETKKSVKVTKAKLEQARSSSNCWPLKVEKMCQVRRVDLCHGGPEGWTSLFAT